MEVHRVLGPGFLEPVYQDALEIELGDRDIPFVREPRLVVEYKGRRLRSVYRADFPCYDRVVVELKAARSTSVRDDAQMINYLAATRLRVGSLLNFGAPSLTFQRFAGDQTADPH